MCSLTTECALLLQVDIDEFTHMIKTHLKKACKDTCVVCSRDGGSNLLRAYLSKRFVHLHVYRYKWAKDATKWTASVRVCVCVCVCYTHTHTRTHKHKCRWAEDATKWTPAASILQAYVASKPVSNNISLICP